jgi:hypothetical protein
MLYSTNCKRCQAVIYTCCHSSSQDSDGTFKPSWEVLSYRRSQYSNLCGNCETVVGKNNPVLELLVSLEEKKHELEKVIADLYAAYEVSLDVTPFRQHYLNEVVFWRKHVEFIKEHMAKWEDSETKS